MPPAGDGDAACRWRLNRPPETARPPVFGGRAVRLWWLDSACLRRQPGLPAAAEQ